MQRSEYRMLHASRSRTMMRKERKNKGLLRMALVLLPGLFYIDPAYAYIDPGTGSIVLQGMLAGIATAAAVGSLFWQRVKAFFSSLFSTRKPAESSSETGPDQ